MAHRVITDNSGQDWDVWEVTPSTVERRHESASSSARRPGLHRDARVVVTDKLQSGWLAFQCGAEKRRFSPVPSDWEDLDNSGLLELLSRAEYVARQEKSVE